MAIENKTTTTKNIVPDNRTIIELLTYAKSNGRKKGWRAKDLDVYTHNNNHSEKHDELFSLDLSKLEGFMEARANGKRNCNDTPRNKNIQFKKHHTSSASAITKMNLCFAWGVSKNHPNCVKKRLDKKNASRDTELKPNRKSVIDDYDTAAQSFAPKILFVDDYIQRKLDLENRLEYDNEMVRENKTKYRRLWISYWNRCGQLEKDFWESVSRTKLSIQPTVKDSIIQMLRNNPSLSYDNVAVEIDNFCSSSSIQRWMASHDGYSIYTQRTLPLLSSDQMKKYVVFAKHLLNNWGLPPQKTLWTFETTTR